MKGLFSVLAITLVALSASAQKTAVTDIPADQPTTIQITKGTLPAAEREFDILSSTAEISGDPNVLLKGARDSWKSACTDWKKEVKELNKENSILALNCNSPKCVTEKNGTTCVSEGSYQLKVRIRK